MSPRQYISQCQKVGSAIIRGGAIFGGNTEYISCQFHSLHLQLFQLFNVPYILYLGDYQKRTGGHIYDYSK